MNTTVARLLHSLRKAQRLGRAIIEFSDLGDRDVLFTFATPEVLLINCRNCETTWRFDDGQVRLWQAIACVQPSIQRIEIEKEGKRFFTF